MYLYDMYLTIYMPLFLGLLLTLQDEGLSLVPITPGQAFGSNPKDVGPPLISKDELKTSQSDGTKVHTPVNTPVSHHAPISSTSVPTCNPTNTPVPACDLDSGTNHLTPAQFIPIAPNHPTITTHASIISPDLSPANPHMFPPTLTLTPTPFYPPLNPQTPNYTPNPHPLSQSNTPTPNPRNNKRARSPDLNIDDISIVNRIAHTLDRSVIPRIESRPVSGSGFTPVSGLGSLGSFSSL